MAVTIPIISEFDGKGISKAVAEFKQLEGAGAKAQFALSKAALPAAAAIGGLAVVIGDATKAAIEDAKAQELLALAIEKNTLAGEANVRAAEAYIEATMMSAAVADDVLRPALATLVQTTGDLQYSQELLNASLDISAATGTELSAVTDAVAKAYAGNTKALGNLVPSVRGLIKDGASLDEIMQALNATVGGAAVVAANSAEGRMKRLSLTIGETRESIGAAFLPILERLLPYLQRFAEYAQNNSDTIVKVMLAVGALASAILVLNTAVKVITASQIVLNAVMAANPVGLVVVAVAALVAGFMVLVEKTGSVKNAFMTMGNFIMGIFEAIANNFVGMINAIIKAINVLPGVNVPIVPRIDLPQFNIPSGSAAGGAGGGTSGPDLIERRFAAPVVPVIPAPAVTLPSAGGGGGGGGGTVGGGGGGLGRGMVGILPVDEGFFGGGGGGIGGGIGNEMTLMSDTGGINITINTVTAPSDLGDTIVNALRDYNRRSGPLQVEIA
jgi:uncharacterized membrane protein YgcG